jgi:beta-propeller repeat-containing protein
MKTTQRSFVVPAGVLLLAAWGSRSGIPWAAKSTPAGVVSPEAVRPRAVENYGKLPLSFEVNRGQTDARVRFLARGQGYTLFLTPQEAVLSLRKSEASNQKGSKVTNGDLELVPGRLALFNDNSLLTMDAGTPPEGLQRSTALMTERSKQQGGQRTTNAVLQMWLVGANLNAKVQGAEELPGKSNYFIGNDPKKWRTNIPTYAKVREEDVYPGVDLVYYGNQGQLEYDFVVRPGSDPSAIKLAVGSAPSLVKIDAEGDLVAQADGGEVRFQKPVIYQPVSSGAAQKATERILVDGYYTLNGQKEVAFAIGDYDRTRPLVIDPVLAYSTFLSGSGFNWGNAIAVDGSGNAYVTGGFNNPTDQCGLVCEPFPTTPGAFEAPTLGQEHAFVTKINPEGTALIYSTWLGGSGTDQGNGIAVDSSGNAYVTGSTDSNNFPTTANAFQATNPKNGYSAFVTKLNVDGSALMYSTYLGGSNAPAASQGDGGNAITVDSAGNAYLTGGAESSDFPTTPNAVQWIDPVASGTYEAFVTKISVDGSALAYSTYLGGSGGGLNGFADMGTGIGVDGSGNAYVAGSTLSTDFPTTPNAVQPIDPGGNGTYEAFATKISADGSALVYSTYLGGSGAALGMGIAVDGSGDSYVTGGAGPGFPTTSNAFQGTPPGGVGGGFVTKLNTDGSALVYSTYLGGTNGPTGAYAIAVDSSGDAYVTGTTLSTDFPTANAIQGTNRSRFNPPQNAFVTKLDSSGSLLLYSTYLGGSVRDAANAIAVDASGNTYVTGYTESKDFPVDSPIQPTFVGNASAFVSKISPFIATIPAP